MKTPSANLLKHLRGPVEGTIPDAAASGTEKVFKHKTSRDHPPAVHASRKHHVKALPAASGLLHCLIAEPKNRPLASLRDYINKTPKLHLAGKFESALEIIQQASLQKVDIVFWDIRVMESDSIRVLREAGFSPLIICISSRAELEKKEFDQDVFSFLGRPLSFDHFLLVVNRIKDHLSTPADSHHAKSNKFIFVKSEYKIIKVKFEDILFCEGMKDYTQVYLKGRTEPILTLNNLKLFASKLPPEEFIRVHRSYIVSISHIDSIARNEIYIDKKIIPVGDSFKEDFYAMVDINS